MAPGFHLRLGGRIFARAADSPEGLALFEQHVRPVLVEQCYKCHSANAEKVKGGLLLDSRQGIVKGGEGGPVVVPGHPEKSRLIEAIRWTDPDTQMPPKKQLTPEQVRWFEAWVQMGAPDPRGPTTGATVEAPRPGRNGAWTWKPAGSGGRSSR